MLCLDLLRARDPDEARRLLKGEKGSAYQPFNLLVANENGAYVAFNLNGEIVDRRLDKGVHVISNTAIYDSGSEKLEHARELFSQAGKEAQESENLSLMTRLFRGILSDHALRNDAGGPKDAICVHTSDYGTVSSSLIFYARGERRFHYYHASAPPCLAEYEKFPSVEVG